MNDRPEGLRLSHGEEDTEALGFELGLALAPDGILLLSGDLGSGKTVLVRGLAKALGISMEEIQSPTYTLVHEHEGSGGRLIHLDLYRLESEDLAALGLEEILAGPGLKAVEWAERLPAGFCPGALALTFRSREDGAREILLGAKAAG